MSRLHSKLNYKENAQDNITIFFIYFFTSLILLYTDKIWAQIIFVNFSTIFWKNVDKMRHFHNFYQFF